MHEPLLGRSRNKARLMGSCVLQLLDVLHAGTSIKKAFLDSLEICGFSSSALYMFYCTCAVTVFAVRMGRAAFLALAHLREPRYSLKGVSAAG